MGIKRVFTIITAKPKPLIWNPQYEIRSKDSYYNARLTKKGYSKIQLIRGLKRGGGKNGKRYLLIGFFGNLKNILLYCLSENPRSSLYILSYSD